MVSAPPSPSSDSGRAPAASESSRSRHAGGWVVGGILTASLVLGLLGYVQYGRSDRYLVAAAKDFYARGASYDVEGCIDETLTWFEQCDALQAVCDKSIEHMLSSCLAATDRSAECGALSTRLDDTHLDFERCTARGLNPLDPPKLSGYAMSEYRRRSRACGSAYRALADFCGRYPRPASGG